MFTVANTGCVKMFSYLMSLLFLSTIGLCLLISSLLWFLKKFPFFFFFFLCSIEIFRGDRQELQMETAMCTLSRTKIHRVNFSNSRTGSDVKVQLPSKFESFSFPIFVHSWRFSVFHSLQSIMPRTY
jgi:hypothetical protein